MARPIESPSGLARENKRIRIDPIYKAFAESQGFNFSEQMEAAIAAKYFSAVSRDLVRQIISSGCLSLHVDTYNLESELEDSSIEYHGSSLEEISADYGDEGLAEMVQTLNNWNDCAEGFSDACKEEWPEEECFNGPYRYFYCLETDEFGAYFMTREAWESL